MSDNNPAQTSKKREIRGFADKQKGGPK